jgi:hypothetical protein
MFIRILRPSEQAPANVDRVRIEGAPGGRMTWRGSVWVECDRLFGKGREFDTMQEAEADGISWARAHGTSKLFIDVSGAYGGPACIRSKTEVEEAEVLSFGLFA